MTMDVRDTADCICTRLRRTARQVSQLYDEVLGRAGVTVTQFTLLVFLEMRNGQPVSKLSARIGADATTLNRTLKPLFRRRLVRSTPDPNDRRVRVITITKAGSAKVHGALPLWREAQQKLTAACGMETAQALRPLLDEVYAKLRKGGANRR